MKEGLKTYWNVVQCYLNDMVDTIINDQNLKYWKSPCNTDTRIAERAISVINKLVNIWSSLFYYSYQIFRNVWFQKLGIPWFKPVRFTQLESVRVMTFSWRDMPSHSPPGANWKLYHVVLLPFFFTTLSWVFTGVSNYVSLCPGNPGSLVN